MYRCTEMGMDVCAGICNDTCKRHACGHVQRCAWPCVSIYSAIFIYSACVRGTTRVRDMPVDVCRGMDGHVCRHVYGHVYGHVYSHVYRHV